MPDAAAPRGGRARAALLRGAGFFGFWLLLARPSAFAWADLAVGLLAAALATWASLQLLAPGPSRLRYGALRDSSPASCGSPWLPASTSRAASSIPACRSSRAISPTRCASRTARDGRRSAP